jgi:hypothetical protein
MSTNNDILKKQMIEAMEKTLGIVTSAAKMVGINRSTHYIWMEKDDEYRGKINSISDLALDFVESQLFKSIENHSDTATIFYLKTKGKKRGYIERQELTGADGDKLGAFTVEIINGATAKDTDQ